MRLAPFHRAAGALLAAAAWTGAGFAGATAASAGTTAHSPRVFGQSLRTVGPSAARPGSTHVAALAATDPSAPPDSTWVVSYDAGFQAKPEARAAFQAAVDIWSRLVAAPAEAVINVQATAKTLDPGVLGQAGPDSFVTLSRDGQGGTAKTEYPIALASALTGRDLAPVDIDAEFDLNPPENDLYFGTDGQDNGKYDFETVVLHELGHGLGFLGSMDVDTGVGTWGGGQPLPTVFDRFVIQSGGTVQGKRLLSYPNGSTALATALTSGDVYWNGARGKAAYNGRFPRLYAPRPWEPGSSFSHLSVADFPQPDVNSLMTAVLSPDYVKRDPGPVVLGMFADMGWGVRELPGVRYTPIDPVRIMDTRDGTGGLLGRLGTGRTYDLTVVGGSTSVPATATAVVLNVTGVGPPTPTDLRLYPTPRSGTAQPLVSNLNLTAGAVRANLVTVPVGEGGRVRILNSGGAPNVLVDVQGWYGVTGDSRYEPTSPLRLLDTRDGTGVGAPGPVGGGQSVDLTVTGGVRSVPDTATAVVLTVTAINASEVTDIRVYPAPADAAAAPPLISNINLGARQVVPNLVIAKVGAGGHVRLRNAAGSVDLVADLAGWFDDSPGGALFHVLAPQRVLDTRTQSVPRLSAGGTRDVRLAGVAGVPVTDAAAVAVNVTGVDPTQSTDVAVYPTPNDNSVPLVSNLNLRPHENAADLAVVGTGVGGQIRLRNSTGELALVVDVVGWFGP